MPRQITGDSDLKEAQSDFLDALQEFIKEKFPASYAEYHAELFTKCRNFVARVTIEISDRLHMPQILT
jgi:hypothetical protein